MANTFAQYGLNLSFGCNRLLDVLDFICCQMEVDVNDSVFKRLIK